jgi:hypothetical protein
LVYYTTTTTTIDNSPRTCCCKWFKTHHPHFPQKRLFQNLNMVKIWELKILLSWVDGWTFNISITSNACSRCFFSSIFFCDIKNYLCKFFPLKN